MPKTGTTSLQQFLFLNEERLRDQGVLYPRSLRLIPTRPNHHAFALAFLEKAPVHIHPRITPSHTVEEYIESFLQELNDFRPHTVVLSSEHIYTMDFPKPVLQRIFESLAFADELCVYVVCRRPSSILPSMYAQYVASATGPVVSPRRYLEQEVAAGTFDYSRRLREFADVFGEDRVVVRMYEEVRNDDIRPLAELAGFRIDGDWGTLGEQNRRPSWPTIRLMRWATQLPAASRRARSTLKRLDARLPGGWWRRRLEAPFKPYAEEMLSALDARYDQALVAWKTPSRPGA